MLRKVGGAGKDAIPNIGKVFLQSEVGNNDFDGRIEICEADDNCWIADLKREYKESVSRWSWEKREEKACSSNLEGNLQGWESGGTGGNDGREEKAQNEEVMSWITWTAWTVSKTESCREKGFRLPILDMEPYEDTTNWRWLAPCDTIGVGAQQI